MRLQHDGLFGRMRAARDPHRASGRVAGAQQRPALVDISRQQAIEFDVAYQHQALWRHPDHREALEVGGGLRPDPDIGCERWAHQTGQAPINPGAAR